MNFITRKHLPRRTFLRGAGAVLALPLLDAMTPALSAPARPRTRLGCIYVPHGVTLDKWTPAQDGADFPFSEILEPLQPHRASLNVISDLELPSAYGDDASAEANHTRSSACFLSGAAPALGSQPRLGVTFDQVAARHIGQDVALPSLELGIEAPALSCGARLSCAYRNTLSWQSELSPLPVEINPQVVFERLFGDGSTDEQRQARRAEARSLLDTLQSQIQSLQRKLPAEDRRRIEQYTTDIREIERRIEQGGNGTRVDREAPSGVPADFDTHVKLQFDLLALAWQAEITRVGTLLLAQETSSTSYPKSGVTGSFHLLSHHSNVRENKDRFAVLNRYHVGILAYFLDALARTPDGEGSLLDHSMVLYGSGISDGNQHDHGPLPIVLAGRASGKIAGNRHLRAGRKTPLANLQLAMLNALDVPVERFADSTGMVAL